MKECKASIDSIESMGLVDGPGIRTVVFLNGCKLRCIYCHNPEMWNKKDNNYTPEELVKKILRNKPYFKNEGGVTFSGGEPLLQSEFIIECAKLLKKENVNIAIDTAGVGNGKYEELLKYIDLVILDIKHTNKEGYKKITQREMKEIDTFINTLNKTKKRVWIRQVIIPEITDSEKYIDSLVKYIQKIKNIEKIEFLPYHRLGREKYIKLNIKYPCDNKQNMNKEKCDKLYKLFKEKYKKNSPI